MTAARVGPPLAGGAGRRSSGKRSASSAVNRSAMTSRSASRVGPRRDDPVLRPLELRRGHQLHRLGDLAGVLDGADPSLELPALGHQSAARTAA